MSQDVNRILLLLSNLPNEICHLSGGYSCSHCRLRVDDVPCLHLASTVSGKGRVKDEANESPPTNGEETTIGLSLSSILPQGMLLFEGAIV